MTANTHRIAIVTDSTCDIPPAMIEEYGIVVVPLYVLWGGQQLREGLDIDRATVYRRLRQDPEHPTTSQPTPADFVETIRRAEAEEVLVITISSELSGTYNSAIQARENLLARVEVEDSRVTAMALGWQVLAAARARAQGADLDGMIAAARHARAVNVTRFTVDTLEYLHRGGRIGGAQRFFGSALQLKPMLALDQDTGRVESVERIRTRRRALQRLVQVAVTEIGPGGKLHVAAVHAAAPEEGEALRQELEARLQPAELFTTEMTPVLGIHAGPGLVGYCAYRE